LHFLGTLASFNCLGTLAFHKLTKYIMKFPSPLFKALSSVHIQNKNKKFQNLLKKLWVLCLHGIFMLPSSIFGTVAGPLEFYQLYNSILEHFEFYVQYSYWLDLKVSVCLYLNQMPINNMVRIMYIFF
jgi:hypothetical protein